MEIDDTYATSGEVTMMHSLVEHSTTKYQYCRTYGMLFSKNDDLIYTLLMYSAVMNNPMTLFQLALCFPAKSQAMMVGNWASIRLWS